MTKSIPFTKMHGLGNDYLYVDRFSYREDEDWSRLTRAIADRHFGVGSDGLITIEPSHIADFRMRMFNADGLEGEMCGNGIRCFAKYVYDNRLTDKVELVVETKAGLIRPYLTVKDGQVELVSVDMGEPRLKRCDIPPVSYTHLDVYKRQEPVEIESSCGRVSACLLYTSRCV